MPLWRADGCRLNVAARARAPSLCDGFQSAVDTRGHTLSSGNWTFGQMLSLRLHSSVWRMLTLVKNTFRAHKHTHALTTKSNPNSGRTLTHPDTKKNTDAQCTRISENDCPKEFFAFDCAMDPMAPNHPTQKHTHTPLFDNTKAASGRMSTRARPKVARVRAGARIVR